MENQLDIRVSRVYPMSTYCEDNAFPSKKKTNILNFFTYTFKI